MFSRRFTGTVTAVSAMILALGGTGAAAPAALALEGETATLRGLISLGSTGKPFMNAYLYITNVDTRARLSTSGESSGEYAWRSAEPGRYIVQVFGEGDALTTYAGDTTREPDARIITLAAGDDVAVDIHMVVHTATVTGTVRDSAGKAVPGGSVSVTPTHRSGSGSGSYSAGAYRVTGLPAGQVRVTYRNEKRSPQQTSVLTVAKAGTSVVAPVIRVPVLRTGKVRGRVTGVTLPRTEPSRTLAVHTETHDLTWLTRSYDGIVTGTLPVGTYRVNLGGTNVASKVITIRQGVTTSFGTLALPTRRTTISGKVTLSNGSPAAGATVGLVDRYGFGLYPASTDSSGRYTIAGAARGTYRLRVATPAGTATSGNTTVSFTVATGVTSVTKNVKLPRGFSVSGIATSNGTPVAGLFVDQRLPDFPADLESPYATTDANGRFVLRGVPNGTHVVRLHDPYVGGYQKASFTVTVAGTHVPGLAVAVKR